MLTCLTNEDALRLIRKTTQKEFLKRLVAALVNASSKLDVVSDCGDWTRVSSFNHQLSRCFNNQGSFSAWATWSDLQSMHPLFMANWQWWEPLLQGVVNSQQLRLDQPHSLALVQADTGAIWAVLSAIYAIGVDEVYLLEGEGSEGWARLLAPLPVAVQLVKSVDAIPCTWFITSQSVASNQKKLQQAVIEPAVWYRLFQLLYQLCNELSVGHRVDFSQQQQSIDQALDRLLLY